MRKIFAVGVLMLSICLTAIAQRIDKPTLTPKPCSDEQKADIQVGTILHDAKKYDEAIAKYQEVLKENPDCTAAMYELSMTYYTKGDTTAAMEIAYKGTKYKSDELPLFYLTIGNIIDDVGKPDEAVKIYRDGIKMLEGDPTMKRHLSSMYYNLGVTLAKQKNYADARTELKRSVTYNFQYSSPNYLLALIYQNSGYKIPAFLAAARVIALEPAGARAQRASAIIRDVLKPAEKDPKTGYINIFLNMNAPKDEGDFGMYELLLGTLTTIKDDKDKNKSENEIFADAVDTVIGLLSDDRKLPATFVGKTYLPFMIDMKKKGHVSTFANIVLSDSGNGEALKWLGQNEAKLTDFVNWAKTYQLP